MIKNLPIKKSRLAEPKVVTKPVLDLDQPVAENSKLNQTNQKVLQKVIVKIKNSKIKDLNHKNETSNKKSKKVIIIGAGFSGLASSCYLAKAGFEVVVIEKNSQLGGRAQVWSPQTPQGQFHFDMGPSWYWMPEVFSNFFADFDHQIEDFYRLEKLPTQYRMFVQPNQLEPLEKPPKANLKTRNPEISSLDLAGKTRNLISFNKLEIENLNLENKPSSQHSWPNFIDLPGEYEQIKTLFETLEPGSGAKLDEFVQHGQYTYDKSIREYMQKPSLSVLEFASLDFVSGVLRAGILQSFGKFVRSNFQHPVIRQILEFPVLFLGATPAKTPKIYTLMAYTCLKQGTFYPKNGMGSLVEAMVTLATSLGVKFITNTEVIKIKPE